MDLWLQKGNKLILEILFQVFISKEYYLCCYFFSSDSIDESRHHYFHGFDFFQNGLSNYRLVADTKTSLGYINNLIISHNEDSCS